MRPNPPETPPQLLDIGTCVAVFDEEEVAGGEGVKTKKMNATTRCTGAVLPTLSPSLVSLKEGGKSLFEHWVGTAPSVEEKATYSQFHTSENARRNEERVKEEALLSEQGRLEEEQRGNEEL